MTEFKPFWADEPNKFENKDIGLGKCQSFEEVFKVLAQIGSIPDEFGAYSAAELKRKIDQIRNGHRDLYDITKSHGLRAAVERLLPNDKTYIKRVLDKQR